MAFFDATTNCKGTDSGLQEDSDPANDSCWYKFRDETGSIASIPSYSTSTRPYPAYAPVGSQANSGCTWTSGYASPDASNFGSDENITAAAASQHGGEGLRRQSSTSVVDVRFNWTLQLTSGDQSQGSPLSQYTIHCSPGVIIRQQPPRDTESSAMPPPRARDMSSDNVPEAPEDHAHVMSPVHQEILQVFMPQLTQYMNPTALLPYLQRLDLISPEDADFITNPLRTDLERRHRVLKMAPYRDPGAFERFVQCLSEEPEHPGHKYLARRLREAMLKKQRDPNAILRHTSSSESPQATSPELQRAPPRPCTRSQSTRSLCTDGTRRSRDESTSAATTKAAPPQRRKSHDSQLRDRGRVIPSLPPQPGHGAAQDNSRAMHQQIKDQVRSVVHNPMSPPYGMLPPTGAATAAVPRSLPVSPVLSRRPSHTPNCDDFRSLRRVPRAAQTKLERKMSPADEKLNKKKLEWLQERVQFQENSELVVFDSHTHCGHERRLLYSGVLQEHGKPRFVVLLNDMLLILKSRRRKASHLDWFSDQEFTARKPLLLHLLTLQKQSKKQYMCIYFKNQSELMEICLQACSEDAKKVWVEQLSEAITLSTAAHAGTVLSIGSKISKKHSGKPYSKLTLTQLMVVDLLLPEHCLRGQLFCVVGVGRQRCRTTGVSGRGILEWDTRCEFSDISRDDFLMIQLYRECTFRPDDLLGSVSIPLPTLTLDQPGPHVMEGQLPLFTREQAIVGTITLHAEIGWETKM